MNAIAARACQVNRLLVLDPVDVEPVRPRRTTVRTARPPTTEPPSDRRLPAPACGIRTMQVRGELVVNGPKTNSGVPTIPLPKWLFDDLRACIEKRSAYDPQSTDRVFTTVTGKPLADHTLWKIIDRSRRNAELPAGLMPETMKLRRQHPLRLCRPPQRATSDHRATRVPRDQDQQRAYDPHPTGGPDPTAPPHPTTRPHRQSTCSGSSPKPQPPWPAHHDPTPPPSPPPARSSNNGNDTEKNLDRPSSLSSTPPCCNARLKQTRTLGRGRRNHTLSR